MRGRRALGAGLLEVALLRLVRVSSSRVCDHCNQPSILIGSPLTAAVIDYVLVAATTLCSNWPKAQFLMTTEGRMAKQHENQKAAAVMAKDGG